MSIKIPGYLSDKAYARLDSGRFEKYVRIQNDEFESTGEVWTTIPQEEMIKRLADAKTNPTADKLDKATEDMLFDTETTSIVILRKTGTINDIQSIPTVTLGPPNCT